MLQSIHIPVLGDQIIELLEVEKGKKYIDATFGRGGHAKEILKREGLVLGIDADCQSLESTLKFLNIPNHLNGSKFVCGNFAEIKRIADLHNFSSVDGILFDLGLSSWQLKESNRGFSYLTNEFLDMRFNPKKQLLTAFEILNKASFDKIGLFFAKYGELESAETLAGLIVRKRKKKPIKTTFDLVEIVEPVTNKMNRNKTLSCIFQALRIAVNDELENLKKGISGAIDLLNPKGRLAVISFHSLEDRIVKFALKDKKLSEITSKPIRPDKLEIKANIQSRSAKLRVAEKI